LGSLNKFEKNSLVILADDDHVYEDYMIEKFFYFYSKAPNNAYSFYVHPLGHFGIGQGADGFAINTNHLTGIKNFYDKVARIIKNFFYMMIYGFLIFYIFLRKIKYFLCKNT